MPSVSKTETVNIIDGGSPSRFLSFINNNNLSNIIFGTTSSGSFNFNAVAARYVAAINKTLIKINARLQYIGTPEDSVFMTISSGGTNPENGTLLATSFIKGDQLVFSSSGIEFELSNPVTISSGTTYWIAFFRTGKALLTSQSSYRCYVDWDGVTDANYTLYGKSQSIGTWSQFSFFGQFWRPAFDYFEAGSGLTVNLFPSSPEISVHERMFITDNQTFLPFMLSSPVQNITISERIFINQDGIWKINVSDSVTVTDTLPTKVIKYRDEVSSDRFWIPGGNGDFHDGSNWSDVSGGDPWVTPPFGILQSPVGGGDEVDNDVYFDENSISTNGTVINVNTDAIMLNLDMSGVDHTFSFVGAGEVIVTGDTFTLDSNFTSEVIEWRLRGISKTIDFAGADMTAVESFVVSGGGQSVGTKTYDLASDVNMPLCNFSAAGSGWTSAATTFNTNDFNMVLRGISFSGQASDFLSIFSLTANLGTSVIDVNEWSSGGSTFVGYNVTVNGENAIVNFTPIEDSSDFNNIRSGVSGDTEIGELNIFKGAPGMSTRLRSTNLNVIDLNIEAGSEIIVSTGFANGSTTNITNLVINGDASNQIILNGLNTSTRNTFDISGSSSASYVTVTNMIASGAGSPVYNQIGGINGGNNTGWFFPVNPSVVDEIEISELQNGYDNDDFEGNNLGFYQFVTLTKDPKLFQVDIPMVNGVTYFLQFDIANANGEEGLVAYLGDTDGEVLYSGTPEPTDHIEVDVVADGTQRITFVPQGNLLFSGTLDNISLRTMIRPAVDDNRPVKEFLDGNTDTGNEIFFRADTQEIQLLPEFETFAIPVGIVTKLERGTLVKCFISLDNGEFYQLEGNATKGVSIVKVHSQNKSNIPSPTIARKVKISWRDSSKQICRITQGSILFTTSTMDHSA